MEKKPFVIVTLPRSGSYHLGALLDSARDIRCYGEIFKGSEVELPEIELGLMNLKSTDTEARDQMGMGLLNKLRARCEAKGQMFGFKDFRFNLRRVEIYDQLLNSRGWRKIFLTRNAIERYISLERANLTGVFVLHKGAKVDTAALNAPVRFDATRFDQAFGAHKNIANDAKRTALKHGADVAMVVDYAELNLPETRGRVLAFLGSEEVPDKLASKHVKQYTLDLKSGVENWDELEAHVRATDRADLLDGIF